MSLSMRGGRSSGGWKLELQMRNDATKMCWRGDRLAERTYMPERTATCSMMLAVRKVKGTWFQGLTSCKQLAEWRSWRRVEDLALLRQYIRTVARGVAGVLWALGHSGSISHQIASIT